MMSMSASSNFQHVMENRGKLEAFQRKHRSGLVTLLFTDIVGSTKLKQELGDRGAVELMQGHHRVVREILRRFPGSEEISTAGDSFFMVFGKPSDGVRFSLILQAKLRSLALESGRKLYDRIGIHVGEVFIEEVAGSDKLNDLYGIQVDTCARVMSLGEGDQILMTRFAYDNARQILKGQEIEGVGKLSWMTHGLYNLKGVEDPLEVCEVGEIGLAVLKAPSDSEKVHKVGGNESQAPAQRPPAGHVVVSTKSSQPFSTIRSQPLSPFPKKDAV
jgi:class 3 adenylate cyclase